MLVNFNSNVVVADYKRCTESRQRLDNGATSVGDPLGEERWSGLYQQHRATKTGWHIDGTSQGRTHMFLR